MGKSYKKVITRYRTGHYDKYLDDKKNKYEINNPSILDVDDLFDDDLDEDWEDNQWQS